MSSYWFIPSFLSTLEANYFTTIIESYDFLHMDLGDKQCQLSYAGYTLPSCEIMLFTLKNKIETICQKQLIPTYSYCRIYQHGEQLVEHTDREACEYSVSINLYQDNPWDFFIQDSNNIYQRFLFQPGDAIIYKGYELKHYRNTFLGSKYIQVFLHYIDAHGPYAGKFDFDNRILY